MHLFSIKPKQNITQQVVHYGGEDSYYVRLHDVRRVRALDIVHQTSYVVHGNDIVHQTSYVVHGNDIVHRTLHLLFRIIPVHTFYSRQFFQLDYKIFEFIFIMNIHFYVTFKEPFPGFDGEGIDINF